MLETRIQVLIKEQAKHGQFNDAIYFSEEDFAKLTEKDLDEAVQNRVNNWVAFVDEQSSKPAVEPTEEELQAEKARLEQELNLINSKLG